MAGTPTALAKLALGTADPVDTAMNFAEFDPGVNVELYDANGTRGSFFKDANRMIENRTMVTPRFSSEPTAPELAYILAWTLGGSVTGSTTKTYPWSDTPAARYIYYHPKAGEDWFLSGCAIDSLTLSAQLGGALSADCDIVGQTADATRSNFPSVTYDQTLQPFLLTHLILTVGGVARAVNGFSFSVKGGIDRNRFLNSPTLTSLLRTDADGVYSMRFAVPSGDNAAAFWRSGIGGAAATAVFTNPGSGAVLTIDCAKIKFPGKSIVSAARDEGFFQIEGQALRTSTSDPVTITLANGA